MCNIPSEVIVSVNGCKPVRQVAICDTGVMTISAKFRGKSYSKSFSENVIKDCYKASVKRVYNGKKL